MARTMRLGTLPMRKERHVTFTFAFTLPFDVNRDVNVNVNAKVCASANVGVNVKEAGITRSRTK